MVTDSDERGVVPLVRVAVKVTGWLTVGVVVDAVSESWVGVSVGGSAAVTVTVTALLVDE